MEKMTFSELCSKMRVFNKEHNVQQQFGGPHMAGVVVFKASNWPNKDYSLESRSYVFSSDNKAFIADMGGNSIFGGNLDKTDVCVRLDYYVGQWEVDYCYIKEA